MRLIKHVVIHHSASPQKQTRATDVNRWHKERNWGTAQRPIKAQKSSLGWYGQYHWFIDVDGNTTQFRSDEEIGWHAGVWDINLHSIGICMGGNFDNEMPSGPQMKKLKELMVHYYQKYGLKTIDFKNHRHFKSTHCPGMKLDMQFPKRTLEEALKGRITHKQRFLIVTKGEEAVPNFERSIRLARDWIVEVTNGEFTFEYDFFDADEYSFVKKKLPQFDDKYMFWSHQIIDIGRKVEQSRRKQYDIICLMYDKEILPDKYKDKFVHVHNPIISDGFTVTQVVMPRHSEASWIADYFVHELMHAWYTLVNWRANTQFVDDTHQHSGITNPDPKGNYSDIVLKLKPYWDYLIDQSEQYHPIINKRFMLVYKKEGEPSLYAPIGRMLVPFEMKWEDYLKEMENATIVELTSAEFGKFQVVTTFSLKAKN